ncbi:hypothetical protein OPT61_g831 [Boeremia exigua]|uniref:Uncharacterized protein n=1 Tax=Boeremia exigua TaxID=749465 RepID=A0ACC2ISI7_9PLEO|nr:hypothetical protein OPT61_g831 [Boeremia exigua]
MKNRPLRVRGCLQTTTIEKVQSQTTLDHENSLDLDISLASTYLDLSGETLEAKVADAHLFCFQILVYDEEFTKGPSGLILASTDFVDFTRIGTIQFKSAGVERRARDGMEDHDAPDEEEINRRENEQMTASQDVVHGHIASFENSSNTHIKVHNYRYASCRRGGHKTTDTRIEQYLNRNHSS